MVKYASMKRSSYDILLPDEVLRIIFADLGILYKVNVGLLCMQWDEVLRAGTPDTRHWVVDCNVDHAVQVSGAAWRKGTQFWGSQASQL
jgi:hypothetical protein